MCGIAGKLWVGTRPEPKVAHELLLAMNAAQKHRGPDAAGLWYEGGVGLAHVRLSIVDLDPRSNQPMATADGRFQVTYNGEVYNYPSLRSQLAGQATFRTGSDTEVLLQLFARSGTEEIEQFLGALRGMFAFAIWDQQLRRLVLARDPIGKKPLYYARTFDGFVFASSLEALLCDSSVPRIIDERAVSLFLQLGYIPAPLTAFSGVSKLEAGSYLVVDDYGAIAHHRYWRPEFQPKLMIDEAEIRAEVLRLLRRATEQRMIADVPVGAFLSGGLDSTAVVAMMQMIASGPVKTFCVRFPGSHLDESRHARRVAETLGSDHTELDVTIDPTSLPEIIRHCGEPFADSAIVPTYFMARVARQHVTVVLNGDGGDENFAGYVDRHRAYAFSENIPWPKVVRTIVRAGANALPEFAAEGGRAYRLRKGLRIVGEHGWKRNTALVGVFSPSLVERRMNGGISGGTDMLDGLWNDAGRAFGLDQDLYFNLALHLPEKLLVKVDRATMAWALEARSPLLDRDLVDFAARIPTKLKLQGGTGKVIFRKALQSIVPGELLNRPKQGFVPPLGDWFRGPLRPLVEESLLASDSFARRVLGGQLTNSLVRSHLTDGSNHQTRLFTLLVLELWERHFIRQQAIE